MAEFSTTGVGGEEATPELLKNTPSNIARLEDVIEHSEGRKKYLAQTRSPSDGNDVRWYFCKVPLADNELAASVPRTEIVGKGEYFRFGMRDSLAIEASFLQKEEELLSNWWREYAECCEGPKSYPTDQSHSNNTANSLEDVKTNKLYDNEEERVGVPVKGGLYEVDLLKRHCFPVYWNGENRRVLRGHWFARKGGQDWLPLRENVAEQLEMAYRRQVWHRRTFQPSGLFAARVDLQGSSLGLHALFTGEDDTWEGWLIIDSGGFANISGLSQRGIKLRRGFSQSHSGKPTQDELRQQKEEEMDDYCSKVAVGHLVFMVHGIGQRLEKSNLVDDVRTFRHITASLSERHLSPYQRKTQRILFIPCQWRKGLKLRGESAVEKITLDGVRGLRVTLSATVHDVLYYMSPIYCQDIIDSVSNQLNRLYTKFLKRNPGYHGKVSIYGHSLGSVLSYDILCHQNNLFSPFPMNRIFQENSATDESAMAGSKSTLFHGDIEDNSSTFSSESSQFGCPEDRSSEKSTVTPLSERVDKISTPSFAGVNVLETNDLGVNLCKSKQKEVGLSGILDRKNEILQESIDELSNPEIGDGFEQVGNASCSGIDTQNKAMMLLLQEIDMLKAKVIELESHHSSKDSNTSLFTGGETLQNQPISEKATMSDDLPKICTPYIKFTKLVFKVDTFFAVGSPLGVFLSLRNIRIGIGKGKDYWENENISEEMPACRQMLNIFHPFDPVAYRIEPLVCKEFLGKRPAIIPYHRGGKRLHIGFKDFREDLSLRSEAISNFFSSVKTKILTICRSKTAEGAEDSSDDGDETEERTYGSLMMERITGSRDGRIDYMLQEKTFEHPYLQALGAHTNYWRDNDTALFILKLLYKDIPEDEEDDDPEKAPSCSECESSIVAWSDVRDKYEEEQPFTFYDDMMIRNFANKAKKQMSR